ncbi:MAG: hypothetical protein ABIA76_03750 [Candidatus Diapherotrites archaeon]
MNVPFLSALFSGKKKKSEQIELSELETRLMEEEKKRFQEFEKQAFSIFAQIKHLLKEINSMAKALDEIELKREGRVQKILSTSKTDFVRQINSLATKLEPPAKHSFNELKDYAFSSEKLLEQELIKYRKTIALAGFGAGNEVKEIGKNFSELMQALQQLQKNVAESKLIEISLLKDKINEFHEAEKQADAKKEEQRKNLREIKLNESSLMDERRNLLMIESSPEAANLKDLLQKIDLLESQRKEIESKAGTLVFRAEKPLHKMEKLIKAGRFIPENYSLNELNNWLFKAGKAIKLDQKGEKIKKACSDCLSAIEHGELSAKSEKEKMKWITELKEINSVDFFGEFFWNINSIESKKNFLSSELEKNSLNEKIRKQKKEIQLIENKLTELNSSKEMLEKSTNESNEKLLHLKKQIEKIYSDSFNAVQLM